MFVHTGDYLEHTGNDILRSTYYTFTPRPLMDGSFYTMDDSLSTLLSDAHRAFGFLEGLIYCIPDKETLADLILLKEICFSKSIDYSDFDIRSIIEKKGKGSLDCDIQNTTSAYHYAIEKTKGNLSYNGTITRALHGDHAKQDSAIRTKPLFLTKSSASFRQYNPTAPSKIRLALNDIDAYIRAGSADVLIKAAMCHYQFEMIHPFECYNGIVGRILPYNMLSRAEFSGVQFLCLSASLYRHRAEYFDKLESTQKNGNYTAWIGFFIRIFIEAVQTGIEFIQYYDALARNDEEKVLTRRQDRADHTLNVYNHFKRNIVSNIGYASERLHLSFPTVARAVGILQELGILVQTSAGIRNRVFAHTGLLQRMISPE